MLRNFVPLRHRPTLGSFAGFLVRSGKESFDYHNSTLRYYLNLLPLLLRRPRFSKERFTVVLCFRSYLFPGSFMCM